MMKRIIIPLFSLLIVTIGSFFGGLFLGKETGKSQVAQEIIYPTPISIRDIVNYTYSSNDLNLAMNNYRKNHGVPEVRINQDLCNYGLLRAQDMINLYRVSNESDDFKMNHDRIDKEVKSGEIYKYIPNKREFGENIAFTNCRLSETDLRQTSKASDITDICFENSPTHKQVLLDPIWTDGCSVGIYPFYIEIFAK